MGARRGMGWGLLLGACLACAPALARTPNDAAAEAQVREVIRRFDAAIVARDLQIGRTIREMIASPAHRPSPFRIRRLTVF